MRYFQCVGGVRLLLNLQPEIDLLPYPLYEEFTGEMKEGNDAFDEIEVEIFFGQVPDIRGVKRLFQTDDAWSMFRDDNDYILRIEEQGSDVPQMIARFDREIRNVTLFCSSDLVSGEGSAQNPLHYPLDQILFMYCLSMRNGAIVHSAGVVFEGRGYIFPGRSGAGKSTISRKLIEKTGGLGLSDDRIIVRKKGDSFAIFGTPWPGEAGIAANKSAPLSQIFFLAQSDENRVERITGAEAFRRFMPVLSIPWYDKEAVNAIFSFVEDLISKVPSYLLSFTPDIEVGDLLA
jgi:hypothetical protein